ncbi:hypothetical protein [Streptomyces sp. NPDC058545]|uniref:hypothetical protein n=1 Tax=Streptomyces sp. NPDC058545 TaxID=3346544 RepID=UPI00366517C2
MRGHARPARAAASRHRASMGRSGTGPGHDVGPLRHFVLCLAAAGLSLPGSRVAAVIGQYYPRAGRHLRNAQQAKSAMASLWSVLLDGGLVQESVVTNTDGSGTISAFLTWPAGGKSELTGLFRSCVQELRACLDALVEESVEAFSVLQRTPRPERPRFFPVAGYQDGFRWLLAESCMDGALSSHVAMVEDCQPYQTSDGDELVDQLRQGLRYLVEWDAALASGASVTAWATPVDPQVHVVEPVVVARVEAEPPGALGLDGRVLARYQLRSHRSGCAVTAQAGTFVDLCLADGFVPSDAEDTFDRRVNLVIEAVVRFAAVFAWLSSQVPGSRRILAAEGPDQADAWIEAARSSQRWSAEELASLAASDIGLGQVMDTETLTLIVDTADGVYERVIPHASPLRAHPRRGTAAEMAVQDAAATWGLPDFVMAPSVERKGRGVREISDGLLVVGGRGVVVQIKAREGGLSTPERETAWVTKQITAAGKQIHGTVRRLTADGVEMVNGRGRSIRIDGPAIDWVGVAIIEHPNPPRGVAVPVLQGKTPVIALLRRDWEFLFNQLRSTYAVVEYLHRVDASVPLLGGEPERYYELAAADATAKPGLIDSVWVRRGAAQRSMPLLPAAPAGSDDEQAHAMVRIMLEDIATSPVGPEGREAWQCVLASVDSLPVGYRSELGRLLLNALAAVTGAEPGTTVWRMRTFGVGPDRDQLGFAVCSQLTTQTRSAFSGWLRLRHHARGETADITHLTSVGVLLTPRTDGRRDWDTTVIALTGDPELTDEELRSFTALFPADEATDTRS